ncbi:ATPase family gene 2 protein homolog A isoform X1 [Megalopta genalis]|uniref:ATPase family gene 2 protein homolog A isoform X1 n=1 Tax=Megalopta genalis TaxID=115081 RepID=UPI00144318D1|nr:ATPase family protein 2 homolog isoform X1 [Megalopta genalis]XP_033337031.1 ATPase family protein 2 homolog isoform X1 [Megalopta genalis]XP_033337032.1 ATPase family protein 2 homolog isoform X1 [Megalopta genalis]XP_033337033.1 ATPase family protein 2 homolog isoform X1 [Megalopta genalis]XP_033337034.1 ATPase family protein 2 homolog isoform X1 [Megalopta genalis]
MTSKIKDSGRKSLSVWVTCEKCECTLTQKCIAEHDGNCPPNLEKWSHDFIYSGTLYSTVEIYKPQELPKNISQRASDDMVFISQSALQLCEIAIGDPVLVSTEGGTVVKTIWPTKDKSLASVSLTKHAMELNDLQGLVKIQKMSCPVSVAKEFIISYTGRHSLPEASTELNIILKNHNEHKIFFVGNKFSIPFYGKRLTYQILQVTSDESTDSISEQLKQLNLTSDHTYSIKLYKALYNTKWTILNEKEEKRDEPKKQKCKIEDVGGYNNLIEDIKDVLNIGLGRCKSIGDFYISKGILLYGTAGVGKSIIANALISEYDLNCFTVYSSDIYSKSLGETEQKLKDIFMEAKTKAPSIILIEEIDSLCPKRSSSSTDHERRVLSQLVALFDDIQNANDNVVILGTTSKLDLVDSSLRRPGRIDKEFEIYVPTPTMRREILEKMLLKIPHTLLNEDVRNIAFVTHGYVGADLYGLCSQAVLNAVKRQQKANVSFETFTEITLPDFNLALNVIKPSAMKEVLIEVPNVRWSDIGGQKDLKLKLKQAVEWPLRHPEAFQRMGITPTRGVLMFGPPGCSKTMIAKALATESDVNFLNIKGPELFSKWVGESEKAVREVFRKARQVSPSIVFIDEIDALGSERSSSSNSGSNVQERVLAQLLTELDGVTALGSVTLVAATNRPDKIDKALLRPGRLDRIIYVPLPDNETRQEIFDIKLRKMPISDSVKIQDLVEITEGYSGAEIQAICHEAAMKALEENLNAAIITREHFKAALAIVTPRTPPSLINLYNSYLHKNY